MPGILNGTFNELLINRYRGGEVIRYGQETYKVRNMHMEKGIFLFTASLVQFIGVTGITLQYSRVATASPALFASPGYPYEYASNLTLGLMIEAAGSSDILFVDFLDCDLEFASAKVPYCQLDKITIYDGPFTNDSILYQGCCLNDVTKLISSDRYLFLQFVSDSTVNGKGFQLKFYTNGTVTGNDDEMASRSTMITIVVMTIVFLSCVGVILPLLFYKHKYLNSKFSNKILPKLLKPRNAKVKPEKGGDLQKLPDASTSGSGINPPDLLNSCGDNPSTSSNANGLL